MRCSPTVNVYRLKPSCAGFGEAGFVDRLKPFFERVGAPPAPGPVSDPSQEGEREAELLLNRRSVRGVSALPGALAGSHIR